jgi:hypothetical protein
METGMEAKLTADNEHARTVTDSGVEAVPVQMSTSAVQTGTRYGAVQVSTRPDPVQPGIRPSTIQKARGVVPTAQRHAGAHEARRRPDGHGV